MGDTQPADERLADTLLQLTQRLLDSIAQGDWATYEELCDPSLTAFEPEAAGHLITGLAFHRFYFERLPHDPPPQTTISSPHVRLLGDAAIVSYTRLVQQLDGAGVPHTASYEETRVWQRQDSGWKHVHFHRSAASQ